MALGVSRSNVLTKKTRSSKWADLRKSPPRAYDKDLKQAIAYVVKDRATFGYRRVWARLKIDGRQINHKRVYRVMRDEGWLLFGQGQNPLDTRKHFAISAYTDSLWKTQILLVSAPRNRALKSFT
jgi:putative transposase